MQLCSSVVQCPAVQGRIRAASGKARESFLGGKLIVLLSQALWLGLVTGLSLFLRASSQSPKDEGYREQQELTLLVPSISPSESPHGFHMQEVGSARRSGIWK